MVTQVATDITGQPGLPGVSLLNFVGDADAASAQTLANRVGDFYTALAPQVQLATDMVGTGLVTVRDDATGLVTASHAVTPTAASGGDNQGRLPAGTQGLMHVRTGVYVNGRELRGRIYVPAPTELKNDSSGAPTQGYIDAVKAAADAHLIGSLDFPLAVWSPTHLMNLQATGVTVSRNWARLSTRRT